jgi:hypothetical protein
MDWPASPTTPHCDKGEAKLGHLPQPNLADIGVFAVLKNSVDDVILLSFAYLFILTRYARTKESSGVTLEQILRAIQPWLVR